MNIVDMTALSAVGAVFSRPAAQPPSCAPAPEFNIKNAGSRQRSPIADPVSSTHRHHLPLSELAITSRRIIARYNHRISARVHLRRPFVSAN